MLDARRALGFATAALELGPAGVEVRPSDEVKEVLPGALGPALAEPRQLLPEHLVVALLDERHQLVLALPR